MHDPEKSDSGIVATPTNKAALYSLVFVSPAELKTMMVGVFSELIRGDILLLGFAHGGSLHRLVADRDSPHRPDALRSLRS
jgi:hypothetical protein